MITKNIYVYIYIYRTCYNIMYEYLITYHRLKEFDQSFQLGIPRLIRFREPNGIHYGIIIIIINT